MDNIKTFEVACMGGLITNLDVLQHGKTAPGSALQLINMEPNDGGGYQRVLGYEKFDDDAVTGTGNILGLGIIGNKVVACRGTDVYSSVGSGWTKINDTDTRTGATRYRTIRYNFTGSEVICMCDGVNKPFKYDGTTYTVLSNAPTGTAFIAVFKNHLFCAKGNSLTHSAPADDNDFVVSSGASEINVGDTIKGIKVFRDQLIILCENRILKLSGNNSSDWVLAPITDNIGCIAPDSVQELGGDVLFMAPDGLRTISATDRIGDFELGTISHNIKPTLDGLRSQSEYLVSCVIRKKSQYRLFGYRSTISADNNQGIICGNAQRNEGAVVEFSQLRGFKVYVADSYYTDDDELVVFGNDDGYVYRMERGYSRDGGNIVQVYQTPYYTMDDANVRKVFYKLHLYVSVLGSFSAEAQLLLDYKDREAIQPSAENIGSTQGDGSVYGSIATVYGTATYGNTLFPVVSVNLVGAGMSGAIQISSNGTDPSFAIKSISLEYGLGGRR